jgi:hypothetical protein
MKTGLVGTLLVGLGSVGLALQRTKTSANTPKLHVLDPIEFGVLTALADRLCPDLGEGAPGATKLKVAQTVDSMLLKADPENQKGFKIGLRIFENALTGALAGERLVPFTKLSEDEQTKVLHAWRTSDVGFRRTLFRALSSIVYSVYWGNPAVWPRIGYTLRDPRALRDAYAENLVDLDSLRATHASKGT